jgi:hypothetical protein
MGRIQNKTKVFQLLEIIITIQFIHLDTIKKREWLKCF